MLNMLRRLLGGVIDLVFPSRNDLWPVKMDPSQIDRIMVNLALNARDAIQGAGTFAVKTGNVIGDACTYSELSRIFGWRVCSVCRA